MTIPDYQTLMLPVLRIAALGQTRVPDVAEQIANELGLSDEERNQLLPSGRQRLLHNRIHWAKFHMSKAGLLDSPARGRFVTSKLGQALLAENQLALMWSACSNIRSSGRSTVEKLRQGMPRRPITRLSRPWT